MMGLKYMDKVLDDRVRFIEKREKNGKKYTNLNCSFLFNGAIRNASLPLSQVNAGQSVYEEAQYDDSQDDPLHSLHSLFDTEGSETQDKPDAETAAITAVTPQVGEVKQIN